MSLNAVKTSDNFLIVQEKKNVKSVLCFFNV